MLSLSADLSQQDIDLAIINGDGDGGVPHGAELMGFAEAMASRDEAALAQAREALLDAAGSDVLVDAAGVAANFQRMVRIADATGIPVDERMNALSGGIQKELDLRRFHSSQNTPQPSLLKRMVNVPKGVLMRRLVMLKGGR